MKLTEIDAGRLVRFWMNKQGLSNSQFADKFGVTRARVTQLLKQTNARTDFISSLAQFFGVTPSEFIKPAEKNYK